MNHALYLLKTYQGFTEENITPLLPQRSPLMSGSILLAVLGSLDMLGAISLTQARSHHFPHQMGGPTSKII